MHSCERGSNTLLEAQSLPELYLPNAQGTYLVVCLDMDPPFVTAPFLGPALHWIQSGFKHVLGSQTMVTDQPFIVDYAGPGPPPGSGPHRYAFFLYLQPDDFEVKSHAPPNGQKVGVAKRIRYDLDRFEKEAGLGKIVAMNYFKSNWALGSQCETVQWQSCSD